MKKILYILLAFCLIGCSKEETTVPAFTIDYFYQDYCSNCENFKMIAIPKIKNEFDNVSVNYYELDENQELYQSYVDRLVDFDEDYYQTVPFIVIDEQIAIVGYSTGEEDEIINEIYRLFNDEELGQYFTIGEYIME